MRKFIAYLLGCLLLLLTSIPVLAYADQGTGDYANVTLAEIKGLLDDYFATENIKIGSDMDELYLYANQQLLDSTDVSLAKNSNYTLLRAFLVEYKVAYEDYYLCLELLEDNNGDAEVVKEIADDNPCISYDINSKVVSFELTDAFMNQTIGEIAERNERNGYLKEQQNASKATSYSGSNAATYAKTYATSYNNDCPSYLKDCTNFVSQCLKAGGIALNGSNSTTGTYSSTSKWYCVCTLSDYHTNYEHREYAVTTSWMRVSDFNTYMTTKASSKSTKTTISGLYNSCRVGDVVQLADKTTGTPYHTIIISKRDTTTAYYCGHTSNRKNADIAAHLDASTDKFILFHY